MDKEVFSETVVAEQLFIPSFVALFVVVAAEHHVVPLLLFLKFWGESVADEASRQMFTNHSLQDAQIQRF